MSLFCRNDAVSPMNQLLTTLRYYATNFHLQSAANFGGFSKVTAHRIIQRVSASIAKLRPQFITFPGSAEERRKTQVQFYDIARFPRVIGAIDCTHVKICSPGSLIAEQFRNRKNYYSLNVQVIGNANLEITDIVARWPGSAHDSNIFKNSVRGALFAGGNYQNNLLLGDAGYACSEYLLTPLDNPVYRHEHLYNESHIRTRNVVERLFGVWKRRFPVLALGIRLHLQDAFSVIVATAVLHNILRGAGEDLPPDDPAVVNCPWDNLLADGQMQENNGGGRQGHVNRYAVRQEILNYFRTIGP